jgi:hypothetical protein
MGWGMGWGGEALGSSGFGTYSPASNLDGRGGGGESEAEAEAEERSDVLPHSSTGIGSYGTKMSSPYPIPTPSKTSACMLVL